MFYIYESFLYALAILWKSIENLSNSLEFIPKSHGVSMDMTIAFHGQSIENPLEYQRNIIGKSLEIHVFFHGNLWPDPGKIHEVI